MEPTSRGRDLFVANLIRPFYAPDGSKELTPQELRKMADRELLETLAEKYCTSPDPEWIYQALTNWYAKYETCDSFEEAKAKQEELEKRKLLVIGIKECKGFDPATSYKVRDEKGKVLAFRDLDPIMTGQIERIEHETHGIHVFYTDISHDSSLNSLLDQSTLRRILR